MTQQQALDILKLGHNVYLTGAAGAGKTFLLNQYIAYLREHNIPVGITASTGIAATHMGGVTIHSWSGMGINDSLSPKDVADLLKRPYLRKRYTKTKVLIIDEISMLHAHRLDMLDMLSQAFRVNSNPFGGMQVIMCGDFFQLPPVVRREKREAPMPRHAELVSASNTTTKENEIPKQVRDDAVGAVRDNGIVRDDPLPFVTNSSVWKTMNLRICYLDEQHRQDDRSFLRVLNDIRANEVSEMTVEYLSERLDKDTQGYVSPTRLFTHNADVDAINAKHLVELDGEEHEYIMGFHGNFALAENLKKSCLAPEQLILKKGSRVMFVKNNFDEGYVNGTLGEVIDFFIDPDGEPGNTPLPVVRTFDGSEIIVTPMSWEVKEDDVVRAYISQLPLRLAWAITVHKSQGMSLDAAEIDLSRSFVPGMGYVALSRVRSLSGLKLMGMNQMALQIHPAVAEMDSDFILKSYEAVQELQEMGEEKLKNSHKEYLEYLKR
jgi:ATP-dependent DNA helicase PIF1